jgi:hypothetical protein
LNSLAEYSGGGTYFETIDKAVNIDVGHFLAFPGNLRHGGEPITSGVRYILAVFVFVSKLKKQDSSSSIQNFAALDSQKHDWLSNKNSSSFTFSFDT